MHATSLFGIGTFRRRYWVLVLTLVPLSAGVGESVGDGVHPGPSVRVTIDYFAGRPNPVLVLSDSEEITGIVNTLRDSMLTDTACGQVAVALGRPGYRGVVVEVDTGAGPRFSRLYKGLLIDGRCRAFHSSGRGLEQQLAGRVLNCPQTVHQIADADLRSIILTNAIGPK